MNSNVSMIRWDITGISSLGKGKQTMREMKAEIQTDIGEAIDRLTARLQRPIKVEYTVERKIAPKPRTCHLMITNGYGYHFRTPEIDMSYKHSVPIPIPVSAVGSEQSRNGEFFTVELVLNYEQ